MMWMSYFTETMQRKTRIDPTMPGIFSLCLIIIGEIGAGSATSRGQTGKIVDRRDDLKAFFDLLESRGYRKEIPPYPLHGPIHVQINMYVTALSDIDEQEQEFSLSMYLRQEWMDDRLAFATVLPRTSFLDLASLGDSAVWTPDPYFENAKEEEVHEVTTRNTLLSIYPNGLVFYSQRITVRHWCHVNLKYFPLDYQHCEVRILSYGLRNNTLIFDWMEGDPLINVKNIPLANYQVDEISKGDCTTTFNISANKTSDPFTCIYTTITFKRDFGHYLLQVYIPSTLIIMLSWVSFWLDADAVPGRISLGLLTVLSMSTQMSYTVNGDMPKVSYVRAVDVWMATCLVFLFAGLLEFALVNTLARRCENKKDRCLNSENKCEKTPEISCDKNDKHLTEDINFNNSVDKPHIHCITAKRIDWVSRFLFPIVFAIFCSIYWVAYQENPS